MGQYIIKMICYVSYVLYVHITKGLKPGPVCRLSNCRQPQCKAGSGGIEFGAVDVRAIFNQGRASG